MTAQASDSIKYQGIEYPLFSEPLESCFGQSNPRPDFKALLTSCWRGYTADWEINDDTLYLIGITAWLGESMVGLDAVFPGKTPPIRATWFSGELRLQKGEMLHYVHAGYFSIFEGEIVLRVEQGRVVKTTIEDHRSECA